MTTPTEELIADAKKARADFEVAHAEASRLLAPPDPLIVLAEVIADRDDLRAERDEWKEKWLALADEREAIRGDRAREEAARLLTPDPVDVVANLLIELEMVRGDRDALAAALDDEIATATIRYQRDAANWYIGRIAVALGMSECSLSAAVRDRAKDLRAERDELTKLKDRVHDMSTNAESRERTIQDLIGERDNLRAALDRVAAAAGVESDSTGAIVADRVIDAIRRLSSDRDQVRVARKDAAEDLERLNAILSSAGVDITGTAAGVADRVAAALRRPALPADLRAYLEARRDRLVDVSGLSAASEIAALTGWIASPTAEVKP